MRYSPKNVNIKYNIESMKMKYIPGKNKKYNEIVQL